VIKKIQLSYTEILFSHQVLHKMLVQEENVPKNEINPFMQMCRDMLALKSHSLFVYKIIRAFSPRRKFYRIWLAKNNIKKVVSTSQFQE